MPEDVRKSLGSPENPWPSWAILQRDHVIDVCKGAGKSEDEYYGELLPALVAVVRQVETILRQADRDDVKEFFAEHILHVERGRLLVRIFTCVNGDCHVPAEGPLGSGVNTLARSGWPNLQFDFERSREQ